jgi:hypothetical protein
MLQKKYNPQFVFPMIYWEPTIFWQLKLGCGIKVIMGDEIICHSGCFFTGVKSWELKETQLNNTISTSKYISIILYNTSFLC